MRLQAEEEQDIEKRAADIENIAAQHEPKRHRPASQQDLHLGHLRTSVGPPGARRRVSDGHSRAEHVCDGIVASKQNDQTPKSERPGIDRPADQVPALPFHGFFGRQRRLALFIAVHLHRAQSATTTIRSAHGQSIADYRFARPSSTRPRLHRPHLRTSAQDSGIANPPAPHKSAARTTGPPNSFPLNQLHGRAHVL